MNLSTAEHRLARYLAAARRREVWRLAMRTAALLLALLLVMTGAGTFFGLQRGFTELLTNGVRLALLVTAAFALVLLFVRPWRHLRDDAGATLVETSDAAFDGRVQTFLDSRRRGTGGTGSMVALLARDALRVAKRVPLKRIVPTAALATPLLLTLAMLALVAVFFKQAPVEWRNAALHVWWGWQQPGLVQARNITVEPGDVTLLSGENLDVRVRLEGFERDSVTLHVKSADEPWQSTVVQRSAAGDYRYSLYRVTKGLQYRVSTAYNESATFEASVITPAAVDRIEADYRFPAWTKLAPRVEEDADDVVGVKNTEVQLTFVTDRPLVDGALRIGDRTVALEADGLHYRANIVVLRDTQYQLVDRLLGREVGISDEHGIIVRGDQPPDVQLVAPGRDVSASPIEEVRIAIKAEDDFAIDSIELLYSVNAGRLADGAARDRREHRSPVHARGDGRR